ncbi:polysaccharide deacetylase family protein [Paenibacillus sp. GM2]|uniref:polysaccharide deacetylase family protein n=1 Tax=Paenibacillus sp. GM2 TaxID=1622070 RepID=UPI000838D165|nr:polysaccharide deacetylase family protein [Paenibacillus sp. GM2]
MSPKYLIINCDDFGQSAPMNQAIMHLLEERKVSSATIMTPAPGFEEAVEWCIQKGYKNIGLHMTLTSEFDAIRWTSLTGHPSLHDESGYMHKTAEAFERHADTDAAVKEVSAQYERLVQYGIYPTHADNHMGSLYGMESGRSHIPQALKLCAEWKIPFRFFRKVYLGDPLLSVIPGVEHVASEVSALADEFGVGIPDYLLSHPFHIGKGETYEKFKQEIITKIYNLPEGISETYIHPAIQDIRLQEQVPSWEKRVWEYKLMLDDDFAYAIKDAGIILTDYSALR